MLAAVPGRAGGGGGTAAAAPAAAAASPPLPLPLLLVEVGFAIALSLARSLDGSRFLLGVGKPWLDRSGRYPPAPARDAHVVGLCVV